MMTQLTQRTSGLGQKSPAAAPASRDNMDEPPDDFAALLAASWFAPALPEGCTGGASDPAPESSEGATNNASGVAMPAGAETLATSLQSLDAASINADGTTTTTTASSLCLEAENAGAGSTEAQRTSLLGPPPSEGAPTHTHFGTGASEALEMGAWGDVWKVSAGETVSPKSVETANSLRDSTPFANAFAEVTRKVRSSLSASSIKSVAEEGQTVGLHNTDALRPTDHVSSDETSPVFTANGPASLSPSTGRAADGSDSQAVLRQTIATISMMAERLPRRETHSLRLRLHPEELGPIDIRLTRGDEGRLSAHLTAESEDAHRALAGGIDQLREALERAGMLVDQIEVSFDQSLSTNSGGQADDRRGDQPIRTSFVEPFSAKRSVMDDTPVAHDERLLNLRA